MLPMELPTKFIYLCQFERLPRRYANARLPFWNLILAEAVVKSWSSLPSFGGRLEDADGVLCKLCVFDAVGT